jgi:hypothetical protein
LFNTATMSVSVFVSHMLLLSPPMSKMRTVSWSKATVATGVGLPAGVGLASAVTVTVTVVVAGRLVVGNGDGLSVAVAVLVGVGDGVAVAVAAALGVGEAVHVAVSVAVDDSVAVALGDGNGVSVAVAVEAAMAVPLGVGSPVAAMTEVVGAGFWLMAQAMSTRASGIHRVLLVRKRDLVSCILLVFPRYILAGRTYFKRAFHPNSSQLLARLLDTCPAVVTRSANAHPTPHRSCSCEFRKQSDSTAADVHRDCNDGEACAVMASQAKQSPLIR